MKANERPLVEDIRLLGRILGDVIREQEGQDAYDQIEVIRKLASAGIPVRVHIFTDGRDSDGIT